MSYRADKPYGRRGTDKPLSADERRRLQSIRRDVEDDPSGLIRRYLRLAAKALDAVESPYEKSSDRAAERFRKRVA
jgi:hypothetical protein